jgi:hypothetical protein
MNSSFPHFIFPDSGPLNTGSIGGICLINDNICLKNSIAPIPNLKFKTKLAQLKERSILCKDTDYHINHLLKSNEKVNSMVDYFFGTYVWLLYNFRLIATLTINYCHIY